MQFSVHVPDGPITMTQASAACKNQGMRLASITNQKDNDKVQALARAIQGGQGRCGDHVWMGLTSSAKSPGATHGTWSWQDGTPFSFQKWGHTQQDGGGSPPICGGMYPWGTRHGAPGTWFDHSCGHSAKWCYACEGHMIVAPKCMHACSCIVKVVLCANALTSHACMYVYMNPH